MDPESPTSPLLQLPLGVHQTGATFGGQFVRPRIPSEFTLIILFILADNTLLLLLRTTFKCFLVFSGLGKGHLRDLSY